MSDGYLITVMLPLRKPPGLAGTSWRITKCVAPPRCSLVRCEGSMTDRSHFTDPRWDPAKGGLPEPHRTLIREAADAILEDAKARGSAGLRSDTCAGGAPGVAPSTVIPPLVIAEPPTEPHPADHRLAQAERAFLTAARLELNAAEWRQYGLDQLRKARGQS